MKNKSMIKPIIKVLNNQLFKKSIFKQIYKTIIKVLNNQLFIRIYKTIKYILKFLGYLNIILGGSIIIAFNFDMVNIIHYLITNYELLKNVLHKFNQTLIKNIIDYLTQYLDKPILNKSIDKLKNEIYKSDLINNEKFNNNISSKSNNAKYKNI